MAEDTLLGGSADAAAATSVTDPAAVSTATQAAAATSGLVNADGTWAANWLESLPPELRTNPSITTLPNLPEAMKAYAHTKSLVGKKFQAPGETSTPEEVAAFRKIVGAPDTPEGYGELRPDDFPEDQWDKETAGKLTQLAHKHHIPAAALKEIVALHADSVKAGVAKLEAGETAHMEAEMNTLRKEWGADFDAQKTAAVTFAKMLGLDPEKDPVFRNASAVLAMARGAKLLMGDKLVTGSAPGLSGTIDSRIAEIQRSPEYQGERGPQAQAAAQAQLHSLLNARKPAA